METKDEKGLKTMFTIKRARLALVITIMITPILVPQIASSEQLFEQIILPGDTCVADGDANGDGNFDISDMTFVLAYLYADGAAPDPLFRADYHADCIIDTLDVWEMAKCIFVNPAACSTKFTCCAPTPVFSTDTTASLGTADVTFDADTLRLDNISESGRDGVRIYRGEKLSRGFSADLVGADLSINNSGLSFEFTGLVIDIGTEMDMLEMGQVVPEFRVMGGVGVFNNGGRLK